MYNLFPYAPYFIYIPMFFWDTLCAHSHYFCFLYILFFISESTIEDMLENYTACEPGPILQVQYVGLVPPPPRVWSELVGGHSALIVWEKGKI